MNVFKNGNLNQLIGFFFIIVISKDALKEQKGTQWRENETERQASAYTGHQRLRSGGRKRLLSHTRNDKNESKENVN